MVDLKKINLLPQRHPELFFCSPTPRKPAATGGGRDKMSGDLRRKHRQFGWVEKLREFCLKLGRDFCEWQSFFSDKFQCYRMRAHPQNGDFSVVICSRSSRGMLLSPGF